MGKGTGKRNGEGGKGQWAGMGTGQRWDGDEGREEGTGMGTENKGQGKRKGVSGKGTEMRTRKMDRNGDREEG